MAVSLGMLSILLMLDICFIINYFIVRALRQWTNRVMRLEQEAAAMAASESAEKENKQSSDILYNNFHGAIEQINESLNLNRDFAFAWIMGSVKLDAMVVKKFPGWKPIPYNLGLFSTCIFIIIATILLSPNLVAEQVGVSSATLNADLCVADIHDTGVKKLEQKLVELTNIEVAREQYQLVTNFHEALVNDTALYGVPPYHCPTNGDLSGSKSDWRGPAPFFPGWCVEALEAAIDAAKSRECIEEVCDCPTLPDSPLFDVTGLAGRKYCGEVCIEVPYPCPKHAAEEEQALEDYRFEQYKFAEERRMNASTAFPTSSIPENIVSPAIDTAEKIMKQVDVASYLYIGYQCMALFFPSPLILFRMPIWSGIKRLLFGVQKPYFICFVVAVWWGFEYFRALWYSPDIRLVVYNMRSGDPCFMDTDYLLARQMLLNDMCSELMPMAPQFQSSLFTISDVLREVGYFTDSCGCDLPTQHVSQLTEIFDQNISLALGFNNTFEICDDESSYNCTMFVPDDSIEFFGNSTICTNGTQARKLVLESAPDSHMDWWDLWIASGFLAILVVKFAVANYGLALMHLADPFVVCAGEFLWVPTDMGMEIKTSDGQKERVQFLEAFDERGRALPTEMIAKWFRSKKRSLYVVGLSKSVFWGIVVHLCMFNLFVAVQEDAGELSSLTAMLDQRDMKVLAACISFAGCVGFIGIRIINHLNALPHPDEEHRDTSDEEV